MLIYGFLKYLETTAKYLEPNSKYLAFSKMTRKIYKSIFSVLFCLKNQGPVEVLEIIKGATRGTYIWVS